MQHARGQRLVGPCQQGQGTRILTRLFGGTRERRRRCNDLAREHTEVIWIFDDCHEDDADEGTYNGLHNDVFDAQNGEAQGEGVPRCVYGDGDATKQRQQFISAPRCKIMFLLWQTRPHCAFVLQNKK